MNRVCNEDCLHCPYEDCILDDVSESSEAELKEIDVAFARPEVKKQLI